MIRWSVVALLVVLLRAGVAAAEEAERGFADLYGGATRLFESDVPDWKFEDSTATIGARVGLWMGQNWALTFRTWYFQSDAKQESTSASDLAFLGLSVEILGRWRLGERWALYGSLGPAMAVTTLDLQEIVQGRPRDQDARSVAPGVSGAGGVEVGLLTRLRAFAEVQGSLAYPSFEFRDRTVAPRLLNLYGLVGVRVPF